MKLWSPGGRSEHRHPPQLTPERAVHSPKRVEPASRAPVLMSSSALRPVLIAGFGLLLTSCLASMPEAATLNPERAAAWEWLEQSLRLLAILLLGGLFYWLLTLGIKRLDVLISERDAIRESDARLRAKTLSRLAYWLGTIALTGSVLYMVLETLGINVAPLLAGVGIAGLAFGFGGQYLIRDLINGIFILFEGQYRINDIIKVGDAAGMVENVNLRITVLRDAEGRVIYIPNGEIKTVINMTKGWSKAVVNVGVAYKEDVDRVMDVLRNLGQEMQRDPQFGRLILEPVQVLGVDDFGESQVTIKCAIKTIPSKQWDVAREFRRRVKNRFDELSIEIPFPHRTIYWGARVEAAT